MVSSVTPAKKSSRKGWKSSYWSCQLGSDWQLSSAGAVPGSVNFHSLWGCDLLWGCGDRGCRVKGGNRRGGQSQEEGLGDHASPRG